MGFDGGKETNPWISWEKMCWPKEMGGLNFRDLELFNKARLATQLWRYITQPNLLAARIIRGIYASEIDLLQAELNPNSSYFWQGLICSRDLLNKKLRKVVGNGFQIDFYEDPSDLFQIIRRVVLKS